MSRNVRNKSNTTPPKRSARRPATPVNTSSDDDYGGVDLISESEEDEPDVEAAEEQAIIDDLDDDDLQHTPRPLPEDQWEGFAMDDTLDDITFFEEHMPYSGHTAATLFPSSDAETDTRRVRFDLSDSSSTMSNDDEEFDAEYPFPEFVDQSRLDPSFRRQIEDDRDEDRASSDGSFWDFGNTVENPIQQDEVDENTDSSSGSESGYDTDSEDEGEDTEDEALPPRRCVPSQSVLRQPSIDSDPEVQTIDRRRQQTPDRKLPGPRLGTFEQKPTRPFAVIDVKTKRLLMFKAKVKRRFSFDDIPLTAGFYAQGADTFPAISPMISNTGNMMMNAMYPMGLGEVLGPPEAFFPFTNILANGEITHDSPSSYDDDDMDDIKDYFDDFIDFQKDDDGELTTDEDQDNSGSTDGDVFSTPRPTTVSSEDQVLPLLSNPRLVGAFRTNQDTHRLLSGSNITADSMRFASQYHNTAITGIKNGHISAAATPITPLRKQKPRPEESSPLAQKRKFDNGEDRGHKRSKSMI